MAEFEYVFPSIRGVQAGREYYISMCPLRLIPRIFLFDEEEIRPELRAQRSLNRQRIPLISRYLLENPKNYTFSSITASIDGDVEFEIIDSPEGIKNIGKLHVPMNSRIVINDGQHRRAAIEKALLENSDLGDETISVVFFIDVGLKRCQQMFADLNRYAIRPTTSLGLLYDHRNEHALIAKGVMERVSMFNGLTETERSTISNRSQRLFTLSGLNNANKSLLLGLGLESISEKVEIASDYWIQVANNMSDWQLAKEKKINCGDLRKDYLHAHTLALAALALVGNHLLIRNKKTWINKLKKLETIDWSRSNPQWEGRAMNAGRLSKRHVNIKLTAQLIKQHLNIKLTEDEQNLEKEFLSQTNGK